MTESIVIPESIVNPESIVIPESVVNPESVVYQELILYLLDRYTKTFTLTACQWRTVLNKVMEFLLDDRFSKRNLTDISLSEIHIHKDHLLSFYKDKISRIEKFFVNFDKIIVQMKKLKKTTELEEKHNVLEQICDTKINMLKELYNQYEDKYTKILEKKINILKLLDKLFNFADLCVLEYTCKENVCTKNHCGLNDFLTKIKKYYVILQEYPNQELLNMYIENIINN